METALLVPVPEAEPAVAALRREHDPSASWGVPAHVTVLYPFVDTERLDEAVHDELAALFGGFGPFPCTFPRVGRFPDVTYLAPEPDAPFRQLTAAVFERWPDHPPYEGAFDDVVPHLTVAQTEDAETLDRIGAAVEPSLPVATAVSAVELWADNPDGVWRERWRFPLGGRT